MKFTISTQEFNYLISKCLNIVPSKATIPVLANILIEASNGIVTLTSTDLTVGIRCFVEASIEEEGATTISAKRLSQLVKELTSPTLQFSTNKNDTTVILAETSRFVLNGMSKNEFPALPDLEAVTSFKMSQSELREVLYRTSFVVSREDTRFALTGVYLHIANGKATFAGTDGKRMARSCISVPLDLSFTGNWIIPLKAVEEIQKNLSETGETTLFLGEDKIAVETSHSTIITKLLSGEYPDINRIIPNTIEKNIVLHKEELYTLLRQVALFSGNENHAARFSFSNGELHLDANSMEAGEGKTSMAVNYQGEKLDIAFNPLFFIDILRHTKGETIQLGISDPFTPGIISDQKISETCVSETTPLFILMPLRLSEE